MKNTAHARELFEHRYATRKAKNARTFLNVSDLDKNQFNTIIDDAIRLKSNPAIGQQTLAGKTVALLFQKTSTRTRCSFEAGVFELGGNAMYLDWDRSNFVLADLEDEIRVLSRYSDLVMARVHKHADLEKMAQHVEVPLINGLSELQHPCQALADMMTIKEYFQSFNGLKVCYIGDGNNVFNSLAQACDLAGVQLSFAGPRDYWPTYKNLSGSNIHLTDNVNEAVRGADVVYTDSWVSMGQEREKERRLREFLGYAVTSKLMSTLEPHAIFMHCLPAHRGIEVDPEVVESPYSVVYDQAENRRHVQKSLMSWLVQRTLT